jgi:hypothetical protein
MPHRTRRSSAGASTSTWVGSAVGPPLKFAGWPLTRGINSGRGKALYKTCLVHLTHPCSAHTSEWFKTKLPTPPHHRGYAGGGGTFSHAVGRFLTTGTSCVMCTDELQKRAYDERKKHARTRQETANRASTRQLTAQNCQRSRPNGHKRC